ncbi:MAG: type IV pilin protein [Coxiellaceae bacterium]|nr:type IV pilin protein [Coxiellaceae bacterium]
MKANTAFSLLELLIALSIVGLLAAIGYPSYHYHLRRMHRQQAQVTLHRFAGQLERYYSSHHSYQGASIQQQNQHYRFILTVKNKHHYLLQAIPKTNQAGDGVLMLDDVGASSSQ